MKNESQEGKTRNTEARYGSFCVVQARNDDGWFRVVPRAGEERTDSVYILMVKLTGLADKNEARGNGRNEDGPQA